MGERKHVGRKVPKCIFMCGRKADSKEHLWPEWMLKRFQAPNSGVAGEVGDDHYQDRKQKALKLRCVCEKCNFGWMKDYEDDVIPAASSLAQDLALSLSEEQQTLLAGWAAKFAMVWEYLSPEDRRLFYMEGQREALRLHREIPENTEVFLARWRGPKLLYGTAGDMTDDPSIPGFDSTFRAARTEMVFGRLVVQVLSYRSLMTDRVIRIPEVSKPLRDSAVQIWPVQRTARWPPKLSIGEHLTLEVFQRRWGLSGLEGAVRSASRSDAARIDLVRLRSLEKR